MKPLERDGNLRQIFGRLPVEDLEHSLRVASERRTEINW